MTQTATLVADKLNESSAWFRSDNGQPTNIYQMLDEGYPGNDSTDYAGWNETGSAPGKRLVMKFATINTPANGNVTLKVRHYANSSTEVRTYEIRQGYVDETTQGTLLGSTTITHTQFANWESTTPTIAITGATDGSDLYLRIWVSTFGGATLSALTAIDADFPDAQVTHNLSGTPDILATTPLATDGGTTKVSWQLTDGTPQLTAITGDGTMTATQGHHELSGSPELTGLTGSGAGFSFWALSGAPKLTAITGAGSVSAQFPIFSRTFRTFLEAWQTALEYAKDPRWSLVEFVKITGGIEVQYQLSISEPVDKANDAAVLAAAELLRPVDYTGQAYSRDTDDPGYTFIQPQQDNSPNRPCPAANPTNADGDETVRVSYYSRELKVIRHE